MKTEEIDQFEKVLSQLDGLYLEIATLSKKSNNDALNKFKLKMVNQVLELTNKILGKKYKPFSDFEIFDEDELPTNSDATLIVSQYLNCMESLRERNIESDVNYTFSNSVTKIYWYWKGTKRETYPPKNIKK